jgi:hypothetical protein
VRAHYHRRAALQQRVQGGQAGTNLAVVPDAVAPDRHVQIGPHQYALTGYFQVIYGLHKASVGGMRRPRQGRMSGQLGTFGLLRLPVALTTMNEVERAR